MGFGLAKPNLEHQNQERQRLSRIHNSKLSASLVAIEQQHTVLVAEMPDTGFLSCLPANSAR